MVRLASIEEKDYPRLLSLMEKYKERPMDYHDGKRILTFDSDFFSVSII
jgi:predicted nucleic acid-binding protein